MADGGVVQRDDRADDALRNDQEHDLPPQAQRGCGPCIGDEGAEQGGRYSGDDPHGG